MDKNLERVRKKSKPLEKILLAMGLLGLGMFLSCQAPAKNTKTEKLDYNTDLSLSAIAFHFHKGINKERKKGKLKSLTLDPKLSKIAEKHSQDMAKNNFFAHENLKGESAIQRGLKDQYPCRKNYKKHYTEGISENIAQVSTFKAKRKRASSQVYKPYGFYSEKEVAEIAVKGLMNSPGHRKNILTGSFHTEGVGISITPEGKVYITQNFC